MKRCLECNKEIVRGKFCSKSCNGKYRSKNITVGRDELYNDYSVKKLDVLEIARKYNRSVSTIFSYLRKYGISNRGGHIDFKGKKIGNLFILEALELGYKGGGKHIKWKCLCDCGNEHIAYSHHLSRCKTARCKRCSYKARRSQLELKKYMWTSIKRAATTRKIDFKITQEWAYQLFLAQKRKCAISGVEIEFAKCAKDHLQCGTTASLDRIDSTKEYVIGNVQWVHKVVNIMKGNLPNELFLDWCDKIHLFREIKPLFKN